MMAKRLDSTKWLRKKLSTFEEKSFPFLYAALLHIYFGSLTLEEIAKRAGISQDTLHKLRLNPRFMRFVDTFKKELSQEIREDLVVNSYQFKEYDSLAADFSLYDEIFQMQIRVQLFSRLRNVSERIKSKNTHGLNLDTYELRLFKKLFSFFILIEKYSPTLVSKSLKEMRKIAEEIVWPALNIDEKVIVSVLGKPISNREELLKELRTRLNSLF